MYENLAPKTRNGFRRNFGCQRFKKTRLNGFTSTTMKRDVAINFSKSNSDDKFATVFEIYMENTHQNNYFLMGP